MSTPRGGRRAAVALLHAWFDAALAGVIAGLFDLGLVIVRANTAVTAVPALALCEAGLGAAAIGVIGAPVVLALRVLARLAPLSTLVHGAATAGPRRVAILTGVATGATAALGTWAAAFLIIGATTARFREPRAAALLASAEIALVAIAAIALVAIVAPRLARVASRRPALIAATRGGRGMATAAALLALVAGSAHRAIARLAPAWDPWPSYIFGVAAALLVVVAAVGPARRLAGRGRGLVPAALVIVATIVATLVSVGHLDRARVALVHGALADDALRRLIALGDADGDGYGAYFGGQDCDDGDPRVHPRARELAGNGRDDNCLGGDADRARIAAHGAARTPAVADVPRHDLVLVTIDSVRADHTSLHGYHRPTTPVLAALAARGTRFARALSPAPSTRWSVPALLFGRHAGALPFTAERQWPLLAEHALPTLASELGGAGYRTVAILSHAGLPLSAPTFAGFAETIAPSTELVSRNRDNGDEVAGRALTWLAATASDGRPRFVWIHLFDPHFPYQPSAAAPRFGADPVAAYDAGIAFADAQLGRVLAALDPARSIVVVTADHGEALGDHRTRFHGRTLYQEELHVPLVIAIPGGAARTVTAPVSLVDLAPTVLELVGLATPAGMTGLSLATAVRTGAPLPDHPVLAELPPGPPTQRSLYAVVVDDRTVIRDIDRGTVVAHDLAADPAEQHPLSATATAALARILDATLDLELAAPSPDRGD